MPVGGQALIGYRGASRADPDGIAHAVAEATGPAVLQSPARAQQQHQHNHSPKHSERGHPRAQLVLLQCKEELLYPVHHPAAREMASAECWVGGTIRPSLRVMQRWVCSAISLSWVTITMVLPRPCTSLMISITSSVVVLSRAPVGSSARITLG